MIAGFVDRAGIPFIPLRVGGQEILGIVDSGFNGDLELPRSIRQSLSARYCGRVKSRLAGGQSLTEHCYLVEMEFDGTELEVEVTFADSESALIGTRLMQEHLLQIDFVRRSVALTRVVTS